MIYSKERRAEVLAECDAGKGTREVALQFMVSESWVRRGKQERREQGKVAPKLTRDRPPEWVNHADWLRAKVAWVEQHLVRELQQGDVVVMDNLSSQKVAGVVEAIEAVGAEVRYLPSYSPDLNPIELAFSKFKRSLRDGAKRTQETLVELCGKVLKLFSETEMRNYFRHCG